MKSPFVNLFVRWLVFHPLEFNSMTSFFIFQIRIDDISFLGFHHQSIFSVKAIAYKISLNNARNYNDSYLYIYI